MRIRFAASLAIALTACGGGGGSGGSSTPPTPTATQISVSLTREIDVAQGVTGIIWDISVKTNGVGIDTATVTVNGKNVPLKAGFVSGNYWLEYGDNGVNVWGDATYVPGTDYTVRVDMGGGVVYSDTLRAPGGFTVDPAITSVAWAHSGNVASVLVYHLFGADTYTSATLGPNPPSPIAIPASAYPTADTYELSAMVQNKKWPPGAYPGNGYFDTLVGPDTYFYVQDGYVKRVTK